MKIEISESKIRIAIWELKKGKTKKHVCETLGISYNTKRLQNIIEEFKETEERKKLLKEKRKNQKVSDFEKKSIINRYLDGESINKISENTYISYAKVRKLIQDANIPIRARSKKEPAKTDHITQDLNIKFKKGNRVFFAKKNSFVIVDQVFDEDYIEYMESGVINSVKLTPWSDLLPDQTPREGVHYEAYWVLPHGQRYKRSAAQHMLKETYRILEKYGQELYMVYNKELGYCNVLRKDLFPVERQSG